MKSARATNTKPRSSRRKEAGPKPGFVTSAATETKTGPDSCAWIGGLLQAGDSFYPTGSYAHSFGLEGLAQEGVVRDQATLGKFLFLSALPALRRTDLPLAAHAWRALEAPDWNRVGEISGLSSALKTASEARAAAGNIGRQRADLAANLHAHPLALEYLRRASAAHWPFSPPVSAALEGRVLGAPLPAVLAGVYYATVASLLAAAMKLLRLGQNGCQALLTAAMRQSAADIAVAVDTPFDEIGWFNPWLDIAAARHETADGRLFIS
jgi:urease accessory protein